MSDNVVKIYPRTPQAMLKPCPAKVPGPFLGSDASYLACGGIKGHDGDHYYRVEWTVSASRHACPVCGAAKDGEAPCPFPNFCGRS